MGVLLGAEATAGLNADLLGLRFCAVPDGTYEVGAEDQANNPVRQVEISSFEMADTLTTNAQVERALAALQGGNSLLMVESMTDHRLSIVARGREDEINKVKPADLREAVLDFSFPPNQIISLTLEPHLPEWFDGPNQPALVSAWEASAYAALFGLMLPTGEEWEAAAFDLRDKKYREEEELRRVAHFQPAGATIDVKSKEPNEFGFYDLLGNVWEVMVNRLGPDSDSRELRGGSYLSAAGFVRAAIRFDNNPRFWSHTRGFRLARPRISP